MHFLYSVSSDVIQYKLQAVKESLKQRVNYLVIMTYYVTTYDIVSALCLATAVRL